MGKPERDYYVRFGLGVGVILGAVMGKPFGIWCGVIVLVAAVVIRLWQERAMS